VQSSSQIITTNKPTSSFFTGRMTFLSPNQQCQSTEGEKYNNPWTCLSHAHLGVFQLYHRYTQTVRTIQTGQINTVIFFSLFNKKKLHKKFPENSPRRRSESALVMVVYLQAFVCVCMYYCIISV